MMAYFDIDEEQQQTPAAEAENRRKVLGLIASAGKPSVLGNRPETKPPALITENEPGTRGYDLSVGATNQPRMPTPRTMPNEAPALGTTPPVTGSAPTSVLSRPAPPNVMPQRTDFPEKPLPTWQKVLGVAAAPFLPNLTQNILGGPERKASQQYRQAAGDWERGQADQARQAQTAETQARTQSLLNPQPKEGLTPEETTIHDLMSGDKGQPRINPDTKQPYSALDAYGAVQGAKQGAKPDKAPNFEEQSYQEWLQTHPKGTRMQFEKERSANTQKPEKPQRTLITVPQADGSAKVVEATPGMTIPKGARTVTEFGKDQQASPDEQRRADLGNNLNENLGAYEDIVRRRPDLFGPIAGRMTAMKMSAGSSDPDIAALRNIKEFAGMAAVGTHAMRNAQHAKIAADAMMNLYDDPKAILAEKGPLARARASIQTFIGDVQGQRVQDKAKQQPSSGGFKPF